MDSKKAATTADAKLKSYERLAKAGLIAPNATTTSSSKPSASFPISNATGSPGCSHL